jgi:hypothetical protein
MSATLATQHDIWECSRDLMVTPDGITELRTVEAGELRVGARQVSLRIAAN